MKPDRTGQLQRGSLSATLLAVASAQPQTPPELRALAQATLGDFTARRLQRSLFNLRALGYLTADHARTAKGDAELARLRAPLRRGQGGHLRRPTGATQRIRALLAAFTRLNTGHLAAVLGVPRHRIGIYLGEMVKRGEVERVQGAHAREYRLIRGPA